MLGRLSLKNKFHARNHAAAGHQNSRNLLVPGVAEVRQLQIGPHQPAVSRNRESPDRVSLVLEPLRDAHASASDKPILPGAGPTEDRVMRRIVEYITRDDSRFEQLVSVKEGVREPYFLLL